MPILSQFLRKLVRGYEMKYVKSSRVAAYQKELRKLLDDNLIDIILFGSSVKGGVAGDMDIALVIKEKQDISIIKKKIRDLIKIADIQIISLDSIYSSIWLTLIKEGFSIRKNKYLSEMYGIKPSVIFKYSLSKLNPVQKVQFARGISKVISDKGVILTRSVVLMPIQLKNEMIDFLKNWDVYYESREYDLLPALRKEELF